VFPDKYIVIDNKSKQVIR